MIYGFRVKGLLVGSLRVESQMARNLKIKCHRLSVIVNSDDIVAYTA